MPLPRPDLMLLQPDGIGDQLRQQTRVVVRGECAIGAILVPSVSGEGQQDAQHDDTQFADETTEDVWSRCAQLVVPSLRVTSQQLVVRRHPRTAKQ